jgi:hypothetical protein
MKAAEEKPELDNVLEKAHMSLRSDVFIAVTWMNGLVGAISGIILAVILILIVFPILASSLGLGGPIFMLLNIAAAAFPLIFGVASQVILHPQAGQNPG